MTSSAQAVRSGAASFARAGLSRAAAPALPSGAESGKAGQGILVALIALLLAGLLVPAIELVSVVAGEGARWSAIATGYNIRACINTLAIGAAVAAVATAAGFVVAYAIAATNALGRGVLRALFPAPLFAPSIMPAIGLIYLVGSNGLIVQSDLYGAKGVFLGALVFALPHATLQILISLTTLDTRLTDAARSLGAGLWRRMATIIVPHCRRGIVNALLITFVLTITDFGVPKLLGGSFPMLATEIYAQAVGSQNFAVASVLSIGLLLPSVLAFYFSGRLMRARQQVSKTSLLVVRANPWRDRLFALLAWLIVGFEVATIAVVVYGSFVTFWPYEMTLSVSNFRFGNSTYGIAPWVHSLELSLGVAILGTAIAFAGAYLTVRMPAMPRPLTAAYRGLASLPLCIPGTVLGLGFALAFGGLPFFKGPVGAVAFLVFNTLIHLYTVSHLTASQTLALIHPQFETVGRSMGVGRLQTVRRVILPMSTTGLCEVFSYLFSSAMTTISAVVFIYTADSIVASIAAIDMIDSGFISEGAAMSTLIFASALAVRLVTLAWGARAVKTAGAA